MVELPVVTCQPGGIASNFTVVAGAFSSVRTIQPGGNLPPPSIAML
jgi:hypothetical protein